MLGSACFSQVKVGIFEGRLARKRRLFHIFHFHLFHIFHFHFLSDVTKASFSHLQLSVSEGGLARKLRFHVFNFYFLREVSRESFVFLLGVAAACVILWSLAAGHRKSYWSGCIQLAIAICQQVFSILALVILPLKFLWKSASRSSFFCFGAEIRFWSCKFWRCRA